MKRTAILAVVLMGAAAAWAQSPQIIQSTRAKLKTAQKTWNAQQGVADSPEAPNPASQPPSKASSSKTAPSQARASRPSAKTDHEKGGVPDAKKLLPKDAVGTESGEQRMTDAAKRDANKRDPFLSPVVTHMSGPGVGCSGGKRCLAADSISLRGIVRSQDGMIAVVVNAANKAYFLRENDPIFNGFVARITDDSMVLKETVEDALGHKTTRDVVKKIFVPAV
ncbi:MAG TPA: hypothetical protein VKT29_05690 [Terriglobales bacterium]|nr:hypothetical protein [Terriglobales bacterium]